MKLHPDELEAIRHQLFKKAEVDWKSILGDAAYGGAGGAALGGLGSYFTSKDPNESSRRSTALNAALTGFGLGGAAGAGWGALSTSPAVSALSSGSDPTHHQDFEDAYHANNGWDAARTVRNNVTPGSGALGGAIFNVAKNGPTAANMNPLSPAVVPDKLSTLHKLTGKWTAQGKPLSDASAATMGGGVQNFDMLARSSAGNKGIIDSASTAAQSAADAHKQLLRSIDNVNDTHGTLTAGTPTHMFGSSTSPDVAAVKGAVPHEAASVDALHNTVREWQQHQANMPASQDPMDPAYSDWDTKNKAIEGRLWQQHNDLTAATKLHANALGGQVPDAQAAAGKARALADQAQAEYEKIFGKSTSTKLTDAGAGVQHGRAYGDMLAASGNNSAQNMLRTTATIKTVTGNDPAKMQELFDYVTKGTPPSNPDMLPKLQNPQVAGDVIAWAQQRAQGQKLPPSEFMTHANTPLEGGWGRDTAANAMAKWTPSASDTWAGRMRNKFWNPEMISKGQKVIEGGGRAAEGAGLGWLGGTAADWTIDNLLGQNAAANAGRAAQEAAIRAAR